MQDLTEAIELDPANVQALYLRAKILRASGQLARANDVHATLDSPQMPDVWQDMQLFLERAPVNEPDVTQVGGTCGLRA